MIMSHSFYKKYQSEITRFIDQALAEDIEDGDHSSQACFDTQSETSALLKVKENCIIAGIDLAEKIFTRFDPRIKVSSNIDEGQPLAKGTNAFSVNGPARSLLATERLVLNCMQRMSGIATLTRDLTEKIKHTDCKILDTRKTTPGFRYPEKWAVTIGGGYNHRMGLFDAIMIKDNHIDFCGGMEKTLLKTKDYLDKNELKIPVIVEVRKDSEIETAMLFSWVKRILLDNMTPEKLHKKVAWIDGKFETEASGNINAHNLIPYAETGVDFISVGALTHSANNVDLSLKAI